MYLQTLIWPLALLVGVPLACPAQEYARLLTDEWKQAAGYVAVHRTAWEEVFASLDVDPAECEAIVFPGPNVSNVSVMRVGNVFILPSSSGSCSFVNRSSGNCLPKNGCVCWLRPTTTVLPRRSTRFVDGNPAALSTSTCCLAKRRTIIRMPG